MEGWAKTKTLYESNGWQIWFNCENVAILTCALGCSSWTPTFACHFLDLYLVCTAIPRCHAQKHYFPRLHCRNWETANLYHTICVLPFASFKQLVTCALVLKVFPYCVAKETFGFFHEHFHLSWGSKCLKRFIWRGMAFWFQCQWLWWRELGLGWDTQRGEFSDTCLGRDGANPTKKLKRKRHHRRWIITTNWLWFGKNTMTPFSCGYVWV